MAGVVSIVVGFTSAAVIVFQAAQRLGASPAEIGSWFWALGLGMGLTGIGLSLRYRVPIVMAWSTPGAVMLATTTVDVTMAEAIGAFMVAASLMVLVGCTGWFERVMQALPLSLASGMLAGILLQFGLNVFTAMQTQFWMVVAMVGTYVLMRYWMPRYGVMAALVVGTGMAAGQGLLQGEAIQWQWAQPVWVMPTVSMNGVISLALPLFVVTMASQNVPGVATIRAFGYQVPTSPLIRWSGVATLLLAPFGAFAINLAAITASIAMGPTAHDNPARRYVAALTAGVLYIVIGAFGATVVSLFTALPSELVLAIAGLALFGTIGRGLVSALADETERDPALITFLVTASGVTLWGIGSAFWGITAGVLVTLLARCSRYPLRRSTLKS